MKKMLSLLLALLLLALCPAMAETPVEMKTLTAPDGSYAFDVPADYMEMNSELVKNLFATEAMQQLLAQMLGLEDASQLDMYFAMMQQSNMMMVYTADMMGNFNVQTAASPLTMDQVVMMKAMMDASVAAQYMALGVAEEDMQPMDIVEINGRQWYGFRLKLMGQDIQTMITVENGMQYAVTFSGIDAQTMEAILASFVVAE